MRLMRFRSLSKITLALIYIAFALAVLFFIYIVGAFIFTMTHAGDLGNSVSTELVEMPGWKTDLAGDYQSRDGEVTYRLWKVYGEFAYRNMPRSIIFAAYLRLFTIWLLFFIGVRQMVNLLEDLDAGRPFVRENAHRLRVVGIALVIGGFLNTFYRFGTILLLRSTMVDGGAIPWWIVIPENMNPGLIVGGLVVIVISEVFRLGTRLEEDQELTI